jgi:serine/threonine protein kinase
MATVGGSNESIDIRGYQSISVIGRGASSTVYRGFDPALNRWVAIKALLTDDRDDPARKRFKREGEITANLGKHPHIVQVFETGFTDSGYPYVVMELFEQGSIGDKIRAQGGFSVDDTLDVGQKIGDAVEAAHRAGVLHRDIKPQNILLSEYGPALADFGIARASTSLEWSQSLDQLTPMHAPPEVLMGGSSTSQSDIYSLGSSLYTMLAGRPPFAGLPGEAPLRYQVRIMQDPVPPMPRADVSAALFAELTRAMAKRPGDRHRSAGEFRDALKRVQRESGAPIRTPTAVSLDQLIQGQGFRAPNPAQDPETVQWDRIPVQPSVVTDDSTRPRSDREEAIEHPVGYSPGVVQLPEEAHAEPFVGSTPLVQSQVNSEMLGQQTVGRSSTQTPDTEPEDPPETRRWSRSLWVAAVAVAILAVAGALLLRSPVHTNATATSLPSVQILNEDQPTDLTVTPTSNGLGAVIRWNDPSNGKYPFIIQVEQDGNDAHKVTYVASKGQTSKTVTGLSGNTQYCFLVSADVDGAKAVGKPASYCPQIP